MRRFWILLIIPTLLACSVIESSPPPAPTVDPDLPTFTPPTTVSATAAPMEMLTDVPSTETSPPPPNVSSFPNADNYTWQFIAGNLERPVDLQPDGSGRLFAVEKLGHIHIIENGQLIETPFLNIEDRVGSGGNEQGLLGLAFHPNYAKNGYFFVNYTGKGGNTFISRFQVSGDPNLANPASEVNLLRVSQPFRNHNGGTLQFGPDGYLYAGLGDGGSANDPQGNGQKTNTLLGKILRLDVDTAEPYAVPADNPFGNEIWAYGLRNPWRISFDKLTGDLYIGDVGQGIYEEIDHLPAGSPGGTNFGWNLREGMHDFAGSASPNLTDPVAEYSHAEGGCSVTGGYVYRGYMPEWNGIYLYGDYCTGYIWGLIKSDAGWQSQLLFDVDVNITSFGQDETGEVYLVADGGGIYKLVQR